MASPGSPSEMIAEIDREFRRFRIHMGFFEQAVAEQLGLNRTDLNVIMLLHDAESMTAGEIAQATSLTTGAVTAVIDRLERNGFARRERDPADRRCVVVKLASQRRRQIAEIFQPMLRRTAQMYSHVSQEELATVLRFLQTANPMLHRETAKLRPDAPAPQRMNDQPRDVSARVGSVRKGRLLVRPAGTQLRIHAESLGRDLYRAHFVGRPPSVRERHGFVSIAYSRYRAAGKRKHLADVALNSAVPWEIEVRGGVSSLVEDLSALQLQSLTVTEGARDVSVTLPAPVGTVRIAFAGGVSKLRLRRPAGVAARLELEGGSNTVVFDAQRLGALGGATRLETPHYADSPNRYEIAVLGGASELFIEELTSLPAAPQIALEPEAATVN